MATYQSNLFSDASGSVGNLTLCKRKKKNVVKGKICFKKQQQSLPQKIQRTRFKTLAKLARDFVSPLLKGFPGSSWATARTGFIKVNQNAVEINDDTLAVTVHPERINFSSGNLTPPKMKITIQDQTRTARIEWYRQPLSPVAKDNDDLYVAFHDWSDEPASVNLIGKRGTPGTREIQLKKEFSPGKIFAYAFAVSALNPRTSDTIFVEVEHE